MNNAQTVSGTNNTSTGVTMVIMVLLLVPVLVWVLVLADTVVSVGGLCNEATQAVRSFKQGSVRKEPAPTNRVCDMVCLREGVCVLEMVGVVREGMC